MAFRVGRYRVGMNSKSNAFAIIMQIALLVLWFYVGSEIITIIRTIVAGSSTADIQATNIFYNGYKILGLHDAGNASSGLVGVIGLLLAVGVLMQAIRVTRI